MDFNFGNLVSAAVGAVVKVANAVVDFFSPIAEEGGVIGGLAGVAVDAAEAVLGAVPGVADVNGDGEIDADEAEEIFKDVLKVTLGGLIVAFGSSSKSDDEEKQTNEKPGFLQFLWDKIYVENPIPTYSPEELKERYPGEYARLSSSQMDNERIFNKFNALTNRLVSLGSSGAESGINVNIPSLDINQFTRDGKNKMDYLLMQSDKIKARNGLYDNLGMIKLMDYDEAMNETWDKIDAVIADESTDATKAQADRERRGSSVVSGSLQVFGGTTEVILGGTTTAGGFATADPPAIAGGVYLVGDGGSNVSGGYSKVKNAIVGNNEGDTWNVMKNEYIKMSPKYGELMYNGTQLAIGGYTLNKELGEIPSDIVKVYPRAQNIKRAENEGLEASTSVLNIGNKVVVTTKTESGMILTRTVIDKTGDISTFNKTSIAVDTYNTESSAESIK